MTVSTELTISCRTHSSTHPEEIEVVEGARVGVGRAQADEHDADERSEGEHVRREDARNAAGFAHGGSSVSHLISSAERRRSWDDGTDQRRE